MHRPTAERTRRTRLGRALPAVVVAALLGALLGACGSDGPGRSGARDDAASTFGVNADGEPFPPPPDAVPSGPVPAGLAGDVDALMDHATSFGLDRPLVVDVGASGDARLAWVLVDLMRFFHDEDDTGFLVDAFASLTGYEPRGRPVFRDATDVLIAWDLPAPPGYRDWKRVVYETLEPAWEPFFEDPDATLDWRHVAWGGVWADTRGPTEAAAGERCTRGCIPSLDDPAVTEADQGYWLPEDRPVFGVIVNGEARAYPVHMLEVHELVNDTLGGRRIALAFCTLCRSAQAFLLDELPDGPTATEVLDDVAQPLVLRTSGLLLRSNKLSYELRTRSLVETFTGRAVSGPLREAGVVFEQVPVVTSSWGAWRTEHRQTTVLARDGGIDRLYHFDPLGDRDADGPIFGVGDVDPRLAAHELVLGVVAADGSTVAFPVASLRLEHEAGRAVEVDGMSVRRDGDGFRVVTGTGEALVSHEAFWFAWSQFHPETELWTPG